VLAREHARSLQSVLATYAFEEGGRRFSIGVSIGIDSISRGHRNVSSVLAAADAACYAAKRRPGPAS
jgi:GGDEF domain-containing protein